uniref:Large ribosomal subunit protein mL43 n=1 Tax=Hemiselmis andersenii TaxID=464988 RepID=A0A6U4K2F5_HEMAN|mmetsp:Transcript_5820/g.13416  ORF Transcript_5820/g.13416 Transcript_5820/m.13416 type:complete len:128 (-) Transcript_5820:27-410(-)
MDARTGVWQLKKLVVSYCTHSGSSRGVKAFVENRLPKFQQRYPHLDIEAKVKSGKHPHLEGFYQNGVNKPIGVKNESAQDVWRRAAFLVEQWGGKHTVSQQGHRVRTRSQTVQGMWTPYTNLPKEGE